MLGIGVFMVGFVLVIMVILFIFLVMCEVFLIVFICLKELVYVLGFMKWEVSWDIVLFYICLVVIGGIFFGLGCVLGEMMVVVFVIGNSVCLLFLLFEFGIIIVVLIVNDFGEVIEIYCLVLLLFGFVFFIVIFVVLVIVCFMLMCFVCKEGN